MLLVTGISILQYDFWYSKGGYFAVILLNEDLVIKQRENDILKARNIELYSRITSLRNDSIVLEGLSRENFGFIKDGEFFYHII